MNRFVLGVLFVVVLAMNAHALQTYVPVSPDPVLEPWRWRSFPELKGLGLQCMVEDRNGYIWFGTDDGVVHYDGIRWTHYTSQEGLVGRSVRALCATQDGRVFAGTGAGMSRFENGVWHRVFPLIEALQVPIYDVMEKSDGSVWAGTALGVFCIDQNGETLYTTDAMRKGLAPLDLGIRFDVVPDKVTSTYRWSEGFGALKTPDGYVYLVAQEGAGQAAGLQIGDRIVGGGEQTPERLGHASLSDSVLLTIKRKGQPKPFELTVAWGEGEGAYRLFSIYDIMEDRDGRLWFASAEGDIICYEVEAGNETHWTRFTDREASLGESFTYQKRVAIGDEAHLFQTQDGSIWRISGDPTQGVSRFDGQRWEGIELGNLNASNINSSILETQDGTLWIGGHRGRLYAYVDGQWKSYGSPSVPLSTVRIVDLLQASDGALWIASLGQEPLRVDLGTDQWTIYDGLIFQCETPDGAQWFLSDDNGVVRYLNQEWVRYDIDDGVMDTPFRLVVGQNGTLWVAGSHQTTAATARLNGHRWVRKLHNTLSWSIDMRSVYAAANGDLWFGAIVDPQAERGHQGGVLRFDGSHWTHYTPPDAPKFVYGIGQTADGVLWFGGTRLRYFDGQNWRAMQEPEALGGRFVDAIHSTSKGELWVVHRTYGVFHFDGETWVRYSVRDGLVEGRIKSILETRDGGIWVGSRQGVSRFDGQTWTTYAIPNSIAPAIDGLRQSQDGAIWVNTFSEEGWYDRASPGWVAQGGHNLRAVRYLPNEDAPDTEVTVYLEAVSQPGNTTLTWQGEDVWHGTANEDLQYAWRLDKGAWSTFSAEKSKTFLSLAEGNHVFEVKARDRDFNEDLTPKVVHFYVVPKIWKQPWFVGLMVVLLGAIVYQTGRVFRRDRRLRDANAALSVANADLTQDRALERLRTVVASLKSVEELEHVVEQVSLELATLGVIFDVCLINLMDEELGVRWQCGAEKGGKAKQLQMPIAQTSDEYLSIWRAGKPVVRQVDAALQARHLTLRQQLGLPDDGAAPAFILEIPFEHGTLSFSTNSSHGFSDKGVSLGQRVAQVISMGYTQFWAFRRLETQTRELERSKVLTETAGAAAHEINQPLTSLVGMAELLLRRLSPNDPHWESVHTMLQASQRITEIVRKMQDARQYVTKNYIGRTAIVDFERSAEKIDDKKE